MRPSLRRKFLLAIQTDSEAVFHNAVWETRCIHCRSRLQLSAEGDALGHSTLEHVIPQAWFSELAAKALCARVGSDADDPRNLALACARCNHDKGKSHDARGPANQRAMAVISQLLEKRISRWCNIELIQSPHV